MLELSRYFIIPFSEAAISGEELRQFTEDHLAKLGSRAALLPATQAAFDAFDAALSSRADALATQEGGTAGKDDVVQLFKTTVRAAGGPGERSIWQGSPQWEEFFPRGLTEYSRARIGQVQTLLDRLVEKAGKYSRELGPELQAEFAGLLAQFQGARSGQLGGTGALSVARAAVAATRAVLEKQLTTNVLTLALAHLGEPERAKDYFNQSLLEDPTRQNEDAPVVPAVV